MITATIKIRDYGDMPVILAPEKAPLTVANFVKLAREGFYDENPIYKVIPAMLIQAGDPNGNDTGGSGVTIKGEFAANGWEENDISLERGVIGMVHGNDFNDADSKFFILTREARHLNGIFAGFGHLTEEGLKVLDEIVRRVIPMDEEIGVVRWGDRPIIETIEITEE